MTLEQQKEFDQITQGLYLSQKQRLEKFIETLAKTYEMGREEAIEECMKVVSEMDTLVEDTEFAGDPMVWVGKYEAVEKLRNLKNKV